MAGPDELTLLLIEETAELEGQTAASLASMPTPMGHGVDVTRVTGIAAGLREALRCVHDAVLLDLVRRLADGAATTRELREHSDVPLIILTPAGSTRPTRSPRSKRAPTTSCTSRSLRSILTARVRAAVRRARRLAGPAAVLRAGPLELFTTSGKATLNGRPLDVTSYEFAILRVLAERRDAC